MMDTQERLVEEMQEALEASIYEFTDLDRIEITCEECGWETTVRGLLVHGTKVEVGDHIDDTGHMMQYEINMEAEPLFDSSSTIGI